MDRSGYCGKKWEILVEGSVWSKVGWTCGKRDMVIRRAGISTTADTSSQPAALSVSISHYKDRLVVVDAACPRDSTRSVLAPVWAPGLHVTISANGLCVSVSSAMISAQSLPFLVAIRNPVFWDLECDIVECQRIGYYPTTPNNDASTSPFDLTEHPNVHSPREKHPCEGIRRRYTRIGI